MKLENGKVVSDRYVIEDVIGSGGMSRVYRAFDKNLNRHVTFKVLREDYLATDDIVERFPQEARAAAGISHKNIAGVYDHGKDGDISYIALEYVDGVSLKDFIDKKAPFAEEVILDVAMQVATGLYAAHSNNIVHRDIKPQNILVSREKPNTVKVTDFGIARAARGNTLHAGSGSMGSVHYLSPEQARNGFLDHRTDIYSLGVCMYEMATGKLPFDGDTEVAIAMGHLNDEFPDIRELNPNVSKSLRKIIAKATEKDPTMRYRTAEDMVRDLKRATKDKSGAFVTEEIQETEQEAAPVVKSNVNPVPRPRRRINSAEARDGFFNDGQAVGRNRRRADEQIEESSDKGAVWAGVKLGLILFVLISVLAFVFMFAVPRFLNNRNSVDAPTLEGLSLVEASILAREYGLNIYEFEPEYSDEVAEGYIISQVQAPGRAMSRGDTIQVIVSLGAESDEDDTEIDEPDPNDETDPSTDGEIFVPNLLGQTEAAALEILRIAMLLPGSITTQESTTHAEGLIMSQSPMPYEEVERDSVVSFVISSGAPTTEAPPAQPDPPPAQQETPPAQPDPPAQTETPPTTQPDPPAGTDPPPAGTDDPPAAQPDPPTDPSLTDPPPADLPPTGSVNSTTINISLWAVPEGTETVHIVVTRQVGNEVPQFVVNDASASVAQFPIPLSVSGTGIVTFRIFSVENGVEVPRSAPITINFDEL